MKEFFSWLHETLQQYDLAFEQRNEFQCVISAKNLLISYFPYGSNAIVDGVIVWEDWWKYKPNLVQSKLLGRLGKLYKIPARVCKVRRIEKPLSDQFLSENHLQAYTNSKIKYGLFLPANYYRLLDFKPEQQEWLVGVMTFSGARKFRNGSISYELLRFCIKEGYSVQGGFTKLFRSFVSEKNPDSVMTYADLDWLANDSYSKAGFELEGKHPPVKYKVIEGNRIPTDEEHYDVINRGSEKWIWKK